MIQNIPPNISSSLVISTYNSPKALELSLLSLLQQNILPDELIIADDGSKKETQELIEHYRRLLPLPVKHIWHEDDGFRKTVIMNKAMAQAKGDYIIQIDGDIIMHPYFIVDHLNHMQENNFIVGSRTLLNQTKTAELKKTKQLSDMGFFSSGIDNRLNSLRIVPLQRFFFTHQDRNIFHGKGCNMSFWKKHFLAANGYDEAYMGWGLEDTDLIVRLMHLGLHKKTLKFGAVAYHLHHKISSRNNFDRNNNRLSQVVKEGVIIASIGVDQYVQKQQATE